MLVLNRIKIAFLILLGKKDEVLGPTTICNEYVKEDGSSAYHQARWNLIIDSAEVNCSGTRIKE